MIVALVGCVIPFASPAGAIMGHVALKQIRQSGEQGQALAKTGIIVGWIGTGLILLFCGFFLFGGFFGGPTTVTTP
jgi:hypothetical protein